MINQVTRIDSKILGQCAEDYMKRLCGNIDRECRKIGTMVEKKIAPQLLYSIYEKDCILPDGVQLEKEKILIDWKEYKREPLELKQMEKVVVYFLTLGEKEENYNDAHKESLLEKFYIDAWKNAYLEGAREYSKEYIKGKTNCHSVCDVFAPGSTGVRMEQMGQFFRILQAERIGVSCWKNSALFPEKTVAGFYFLMQEAGKTYEKSCANCIGERIGCQYCASAKKSNLPQ